MGKFNFPWEFSPLILIISPARCEQVKSKLVFDYAEPDLQHGGYGFSLCWSWGGRVFAKIVLAELNWTVFLGYVRAYKRQSLIGNMSSTKNNM